MDTVEVQLAIADYMRWLRIFNSATHSAGRSERSRRRTLREGVYAAKRAGACFAKVVALKKEQAHEAGTAGAEPAPDAQ